MDRKNRAIEIAYRKLRRALQDESRKSARGPHRYAYTEAQLERKLRREPPLSKSTEPADSGESVCLDLLEEQLLDLLRGLGLAPRHIEVSRMRYRGYTVAEVAAKLGISQRRVYKLMSDVRFALGEDLCGAEKRIKPGEVPYYGWQETYVDAVRPQRGSGRNKKF